MWTGLLLNIYSAALERVSAAALGDSASGGMEALMGEEEEDVDDVMQEDAETAAGEGTQAASGHPPGGGETALNESGF